MKDLSQMEAVDLEVDDEEDIIGCLPTVLTPAHRLEIDTAVNQLPECIGSEDISKIENNLERYCKLLKLYQEQPNLLDGYIPAVVQKLLSYIQLPSSESSNKSLSNVSNAALEYLEHLTTVRGAKVISRLLPHEVIYLDKLLITLENVSSAVEEGLRERRMLLLWLWIVCKNPFDMRRFDKKDSPGYTLKRIFNVVEPYLTGMLSKCHRVAALVLSQCIARTDGLLLLDETISSCIHKLGSENDSLGGLILLAAVLKHVDRQHIITKVDKLIEAISSFFPLNSTNVLVRKYLVKTAQRIALTLLKPRVASWRYRRGKRSLEESLATVNNSATSYSNGNCTELDENDDCDVSPNVEWVLGCLLEAIKDDDTSVRWSAAKGIGRICSRLPKELTTQVVDAIVDNNFHRLAGHCSWHGGCMSLAELSRRGFLLPETLPKVFEIVQAGLFYEEPMGRQALGANVRDAACYILWSFARAYEPEDLRPYVDKVATSLMCVTLFDREVRLRRAASAAFQENVGRQANFPDGIALLTIVDYFAVGNRERCYLRLTKEVASFSKYAEPIIDHLVEKKVAHWDISVRIQAANALTCLASHHSTYVSTKLPALLEGTSTDNPIRRHGSIIALAHTVKGLIDCGHVIPEEIRSTLTTIPGQLKTDFNNQRTGELTRLAVTEFIRVLSSVGLELTQNQINTWLSLLEIACTDKNQNFRKTAAISAAIFIENYILPGSKIAEEVKSKFKKEIKSPTGLEWTRIGYCNLAGCLPSHAVDFPLFEALCSTILSPALHDKKWALAREAAVQAISSMFLASNDDSFSALCFESLFKALEDYTNDIHGDIGRFVRQQGMRSLTDVLTAETTQIDLKERYVPLAVKRMVQQSAEKIGRTREVACNCIVQLIQNSGTNSFVPHAETLAKVYKDGHDFIQDKILLNLTSLFPCEEYYKDIVQGLVLSAGGVSELTGRFSTEAFLVYQDSVANDFILIEKLLSAVADLLDVGMKNIRIGECVLRFLPQLLRRLPIDDSFSDNSKGLGRIVCRLEKLVANQNLPPRRFKMILNAFSSLLLLSPTSKMWNKAMRLIASNLSNPTPAMRRFAAESLLESIWATDVDESIMTLLSETPWQETNDLPAIFNAANSIQTSLGVI